MLTLILADTELELIPPELADHPAVRASSKKRRRAPVKTLLDSSLHHPALRKFPEGERRGRPDLVHVFVLLCLDSILNQEGRLRTIVHTRNDDVIRFSSETRIPRNYTRFCGLLEDLFEKGAVPSEAPLLTLERGLPLGRLVDEREGVAWAFEETGQVVDLRSEFSTLEGDFTAVIGGFPHGAFRSPVSELCDRVVSLHPKPIKAWTVASEILTAYRHFARRAERESS